MTETSRFIMKALRSLESEKDGMPPYDIESIRETKNIIEALEIQKNTETLFSSQQFLGRCAIRLQEGINVYTKARFARIMELKSKSRGPLKTEYKRNFSPAESDFLSDYIKATSVYYKEYGFDPSQDLRTPKGLIAECVVIKGTGNDPINIGGNWVVLKENEIITLRVQDAEEYENLGYIRINEFYK